MIEAYKKTYIPLIAEETLLLNTPPLKHMLYIYHPIWSKRDQAKIQALIDSDVEINAITSTYTAKLSLKVWSTDVGVQKINDSNLKMFGIVLTSFEVNDKLSKTCFFQKTFFLLAKSRPGSQTPQLIQDLRGALSLRIGP